MAVFEKRDPNQGASQPKPPPPPTRSSFAPPETRSLSSPSSAVSTIGESIVVKGDISGSEDISVNGSVEGSIFLTSNHVTINSTGRIAANIKAKSIEVSGTVEGDLAGGDVVKINSSGKLKGNIVAPRIVLQDGAKLKGMIDMEMSGGSKEQKAASASKSGGTASTPVLSGSGNAASGSGTAAEKVD